MIVFIPWPSHKLSSNARGGWYSKEKDRKDAVGVGMMLGRTSDKRGVDFKKRLCLRIDILPPNKKHDTLNVVDSLKPWIDGVCRGAGFDDRQIKQVIVNHYDQEPFPGGRIVLSFSEATQDDRNRHIPE